MMINAISNNMMYSKKINFKSTEKTREEVRKATEEWQRVGKRCREFMDAHSPHEIMTNDDLYREYHSIQDELGQAYSRKARAEFVDETGQYPNNDYYYHY
ncbi:hypothetical protein IJI31_04675 [bacterium]|nr:hypothetical protein [bacterium]